MKRHIPNTLTCMNLFSGCLSVVMAFSHNYQAAFAFILLSAVFDFFDGLAARALHAHSPIGKDLYSLADDVSFGVAPASMLFNLLMQEFVAEGAAFSTLFTGDSNHAQRIYKRAGFDVVRRFALMGKSL